jgi:D-glycero-alpha-D-manno-heptose 1-phosphate guanylyltransferase
MQIKEAIILAGGLGTRLRDAVPDLPKCMAPVNNRPFIFYVIDYLQKQGVEQVIFSLGYRSDAFTQFLSDTLSPGKYQVVIEEEPLGTGGAIQFAAKQAKEENVVIVNGDSIFKADLQVQAEFHFSHHAECTLALKPMKNFERYGVVELNSDNSVALFKEKQLYAEGLINGGVYLLNLPHFFEKGLPEKFSFETDYLQKFYADGKIFGVEQDGYFIDIGIPEDYARAQKELI